MYTKQADPPNSSSLLDADTTCTFAFEPGSVEDDGDNKPGGVKDDGDDKPGGVEDDGGNEPGGVEDDDDIDPDTDAKVDSGTSPLELSTTNSAAQSTEQ
jgi:hypothetical protein